MSLLWCYKKGDLHEISTVSLLGASRWWFNVGLSYSVFTAEGNIGETFMRQLYKENQILVYSRVLTINHACTLLRKRHLWTEE